MVYFILQTYIMSSSDTGAVPQSLKRKQPAEATQQNKKRKKSSSRPVITYEPGLSLFDAYKPGVIIKVFIPAKYFIVQSNNSSLDGDDSNREEENGESDEDDADSIEERRVYGTDIYSEDSDLVGACQHVGLLRVTELQRSASKIKGLLVSVKIHTPPHKFQATFRNNVRSRNWVNPPDATTNGYSVESVKVLYDKLTPVAVEDAKPQFYDFENSPMDHSALEQHRFLPNVSVVFNLDNEPCLKYTLNSVADKGWSSQHFTSKRLQGNEMLILEAPRMKYEISYDHEKKKYMFVVIDPFAKTREVVNDNLDWRDIEWGIDSVLIRPMETTFKNIRIMQFKLKK
ncbi:hypothetical protein AKO1_008148 [Acrasis kona]|uniref:Uncharacterized protein n=1 Tax=Acrasis kona TaxID=1008807 RepID=A0AAW2YP31_9EUKA